ncbi:hypothetical protein RMSM_07600 [Rhodopirellula maiorica SM1]|uniref:Uncharacterized protein n=1 Tax=Rhodopirellula maiorica SM1 TaxID=1265738 RepID=M5R7L4_9BACT|nr:hypothetical protein [Rhodopirellula maiorica]EMI15478.1 hypothetical protein RMSM_07600 [Rhodopirellula maiorica SM1]
MFIAAMVNTLISSYNGVKADVAAAAVSAKALTTATTIAEVWSALSGLAIAVNSIHDTLTIAFTALDLLNIDPADIRELGDKVRQSIDFTNVTGVDVGFDMPRPVEIELPVKLRGKLGLLFKSADGITLGKASETLGELGAAALLQAIGMENKDVPVGYHGFDGVFYEPQSERYVIMEAKGNSSQLQKRATGWQMRDKWINTRIEKMAKKGFGGDIKEFARENDRVRMGTKKMWAIVSKTSVDDNNKVKFHFRVRSYGGISERASDRWGAPLD